MEFVKKQFILIKNYLRSLPNALSNYFQHFIGSVQSTLNDKTADGNMKINALHFILVALNSHHSEVFFSMFLSVQFFFNLEIFNNKKSLKNYYHNFYLPKTIKYLKV